jgi:hypothetical protein
MNWNDLLQILHSAFMDELRVIFPDESFEVDLPKQFNQWSRLEGYTHELFVPVTLTTQKGVVCFSSNDTTASQSLIQPHWVEQVLERCRVQISRKNFPIIFQKPVKTAKETESLNCLVWFPIKIKNVSYLVGLGSCF